MRASPQETTGTAGLNEVKANFQRIGWAAVGNAQHDLGTDLFLQARDDRRYERGLLVLAQVKAGLSYFDSPLYENGEVVGWWYYEPNTRHFGDWVAHSLPHLLVLHDLSTRTSYWVDVTGDRVISTGQGCKILVPKSQTVDAGHVRDLYDIACQLRAAPALEGTAFSGPPEGISPDRRLRYALLAPRLIAPHPNSGHQGPIDAVEAVGLIAQGRFRSLRTFAEGYPEVPDPGEDPGPQWGWRFVAALWDWAIRDSIEQLVEVFNHAPSRETAAASGVLLACVLRRLERHDRALGVLNGLIDGDDLSPVDHGWVLIHRARIRTDKGDLAGARNDANRARESLQGDEQDVTVSGLVAGAAWQHFVTVDQLTRDGNELREDFENLISASDTAISWWRSQTTSWGLVSAERNHFRFWADSISLPMESGTQHLFAAELNADLTGEHGNWRTTSALAARQRLQRARASTDPAKEVVIGLDALRRSGDHQSLRSALGGC